MEENSGTTDANVREMELRRRKKDEEKNTTEVKIKKVQRAKNWKKKKGHLLESLFPYCLELTILVHGFF